MSKSLMIAIAVTFISTIASADPRGRSMDTVFKGCGEITMLSKKSAEITIPASGLGPFEHQVFVIDDGATVFPTYNGENPGISNLPHGSSALISRGLTVGTCLCVEGNMPAELLPRSKRPVALINIKSIVSCNERTMVSFSSLYN